MHDTNITLVVDVDGSLLRSDLLMESFWAALGIDFFATVWVVLRFIWWPAMLKRELNQIANLDVVHQPIREEVLDYCLSAQISGRKIALASGSDQKLVDDLASHLNFAGKQFASDGKTNMTGGRKSEKLQQEYGEYGFDYIGNARPDLKVWRYAHSIIVVGPSRTLMNRVSKLGRSVEVIGERWKWKSLMKGLRPYQWVKNLLLLLPIVAAHNFELQNWLPVILGIVSFSAAASTIYIVNDLLDLSADRKHPTKCLRPFAAGTVPISVGMIAGLALGFASILIGLFINWMFAGVIGLYIMTSLAYSLRLKRIRWIDIFVLAWLYTLRVLAGGVAIAIPLSGWLLVFVFAAFLSLGAVKRMTELAKAPDDNILPGRGYSHRDLNDLFNISAMAVFSAVTMFLAYSYSATAVDIYSNLWLLRATAIPLAAWLVRMIVLGRQGKQDYDPIIFASHDKWGLAIIAVAGALMLSAA